MKILGLDPSLTNFGWCFIDSDGSTVIERGRFKTTPKQIFIERYVQLRGELSDLIDRLQPDRVGIESPIFNDLYSEGMYGLFLFCNEVFMTKKKDVAFFTPPQVKSHAWVFLNRPKGWKMKKQDMCEAAKTKSGGGKWNHNEADAYWVGVTAYRFWKYYDGEITLDDLSIKEKPQFTKIHTFSRGKRIGKTVKSGLIHREDDRFFLWSQK